MHMASEVAELLDVGWQLSHRFQYAACLGRQMAGTIHPLSCCLSVCMSVPLSTVSTRVILNVEGGRGPASFQQQTTLWLVRAPPRTLNLSRTFPISPAVLIR